MGDWFAPLHIVKALASENGKLTTAAYLSVVTFMAAVVYTLCFPPARPLASEISSNMKSLIIYPTVITSGSKYKVITQCLNLSPIKSHEVSILLRSSDHYMSVIALKSEKSERHAMTSRLSPQDGRASRWPVLNAMLLAGEAQTKEIDLILHEPETGGKLTLIGFLQKNLTRYNRFVDITVEIDIDRKGYVEVGKFKIWASSLTDLARRVLAFLAFTITVVETARRLSFDAS